MRYRIQVGLTGYVALPWSSVDGYLGTALVVLGAGVLARWSRELSIPACQAVCSVLTRLSTGVLVTRAGQLATPAEIERLVQGLGLGGGELVLDVHAGSALMREAVARRLTTGRLYSLQLEPGRAHAGPSRTSARLSPDGDFLFQDDSFDLVIARLALHGVAQHSKRAHILREMVRVLKPDGQLVLADRHARQFAGVLLGAGLRGMWSRPESLLTLPRVDVLTARKPSARRSTSTTQRVTLTRRAP
jgi:SAM-dependent methyltransferase